MIPKATSVTLHLDRWGINMAREANIPVFQPQPNKVQGALDHRKMAQTPDLRDDVQFMQQRREQNPSQQVADNLSFRDKVKRGFRNQPKDFMTQGIRGIQNLQRRNRDALQRPREEVVEGEEVVGSMSPDEKIEHGEQVIKLIAMENLLARALGPNAEKEISNVSKDLLGVSTEDPTIIEKIPSAQGGLIGMALGGRFEGRVRGDGHGMQDNVFMPIQERGEQVATLAVSPKEYVVDAHTMSALGNGNADKGADVMDNVVENIREKAYGTDQQPNQINGLAALRPMMERV